MLNIAGDFHTHTTHSHGTGSVEDNVKAAIDKGLRAIAISDHGMGHLFYNISDMGAYLRDIEDMRAKYADKIHVFSGYEGNLSSLNGQLDIPADYAAAIDIPFFGYHKMVRYPAPADWLHFMLPKRTSEPALRKNVEAYDAAMRNNRVRFISHPGYGLPVSQEQLAKRAAANDVLLEINAKHPEFTVQDLMKAANAGARFIIGSDAHSPGRVGDFRAAVDKAEEAGISPLQIVNSEENIERFIADLENDRRTRRPGFGDVLTHIQRGGI